MSRRHGRWDLLHLQSGNADLVPADGFSIRDLARTLRQIQHNLDDVRTRLLRAHDADAWVGEAAKASVEKSHTVVKQLAKSSTKFELAAGALEAYAPAVDEARSVTRSALVLAEDAERRRKANAVSLTAHVLDPSPELRAAESGRIARLEDAEADMDAARRQAQGAEETFHNSARTCARTIDPDHHAFDAWVLGGLGALGGISTNLGLVTEGIKRLIGGLRVEYAFFRRYGRQMPPNGLSFWSRVKRFVNRGVMVSRKGMVDAHHAWLNKPWVKAGRAIGRATPVLSALSFGLDFALEYGNEENAHKSTAYKTGAAMTMAGAKLAGGLAFGALGAKGGALLGAAIGSVFPGPGTVIGGAAGGVFGFIFGAIVGSGAGEWAGNEFKDLGGQAAEAIGHAAGGVVDAIAKFRAPKISLPHPHFW